MKSPADWTLGMDIINTSTALREIPEDEREQFLEDYNWKKLTHSAPFVVYFSLLMFAGILGNIVVFNVYYRRFNASVTRTCVLTMSVVDLLTNLVALPVEILRIRYHATFYADWECKLHWFVISTLVIYSAIVLVLVAVDRRRLICSRYAGQQRSTLKKIKIALLVGFGIAMFLSVPRLVIMGKQTVIINGSDITGVQCAVEDVHEPTAYVKAYNAFLAVWFILNCVVMNVSYGQIAYFLRQHRHRTIPKGGSIKKQLDSASPNQIKAEMSLDVCQDSQDSHTADTFHTTESTLSDTEDKTEGEVNEASLRKKAGSMKEGSTKLKMLTNRPVTTGFIATDSEGNKTNQPITPYNDWRVSHAATNEVLYSDSSTDMVTDSQDDSRNVDPSSTIVSDNPAGADGPSVKGGKGTLSRAKPIRRSTGRRGKQIPKRTTLMLFVLSVVFVVNFLPFLVLELIEKLKPILIADFVETNLYLVLSNTQYLNSVANPLVYSFCSARFRYECRKLFGSWLHFCLTRIRN